MASGCGRAGGGMSHDVRTCGDCRSCSPCPALAASKREPRRGLILGGLEWLLNLAEARALYREARRIVEDLEADRDE